MMIKTTLRDRIRAVSKRWDHQYHDGSDADKVAVGNNLRDMNLETASAREVEAVIGNGSWTSDTCSACNESTEDTTYTVGAEMDYESATATLCAKCAMAFARMVMADQEK